MNAAQVEVVQESIVDEKLTLNEVADMILDELLEEAQSRCSRVCDLLSEMREKEPDLASYFKDAKPPAKMSLSVSLQDYGPRKGKVVVEFSGQTSHRVPKAFTAGQERINAQRLVYREAQTVAAQMAKGRQRAKNQLIRQALSTTASGQRALEALAQVKAQVKATLALPAGK